MQFFDNFFITNGLMGHHQGPVSLPGLQAQSLNIPTSTSKDFEMRLIPMIYVKLWPDQCQEESSCVRLEMEQVPSTKVSPMNLQ